MNYCYSDNLKQFIRLLFAVVLSILKPFFGVKYGYELFQSYALLTYNNLLLNLLDVVQILVPNIEHILFCKNFSHCWVVARVKIKVRISVDKTLGHTRRVFLVFF
jgi:hypothetical protein